MNLLTSTDKIAHKKFDDFIYHYNSNFTDVVMVSLLPMHQLKENSDAFCRESRDVRVVQDAMNGQFYSGYDNINVDTHSDSGECVSLGDDDTMSECLDRGRGINLFENYAMEKLFDNGVDRDILIDDAMNEDPSLEEMDSGLGAGEAGIFKYSERVNDNVNVKQECIDENNKNISFRCSYCGKTCSDKRSLMRHQIKSCKEYERGGKGCPECDHIFISEGLCNMHLNEVHHTKKHWFKCSCCDESYAYFHDLEIHRKKHYVCPKCGKEFFDIKNMNIHVDIKHNNRQRMLECSYCDLKFDCVENVKRHMRRKHNSVYKCDNCIKTFVSFNALKEHCNEIHNHNTKLYGQCIPCKMGFLRERDYVRHIKTENHKCEMIMYTKNPV